MCGIAGISKLSHETIPNLGHQLTVMNHLIAHRGPDGEGIWQHDNAHVGFAHRRLSIIDIETGQQPMRDGGGNWLIYNGEIYNYIELREELGLENFETTSDTEVILEAYRKWGEDCVSHFRGMFAFALWDEDKQELFIARDRFGIKPMYYTIVDDTLYFASEMKALMPFLETIETDLDAFQDYLTFQFCLDGKTLFKNVYELLPGHVLTTKSGHISTRRYWQVFYSRDFAHSESYFEQQIQEQLAESVKLHLRADVPVGSYLSGGLDSGIISALASNHYDDDFLAFTGKFTEGDKYDESEYARAIAENSDFTLHELDINVDDFVQNIEKVIYHLDAPIAGPGSFPQYMVSQMASQHRKVVLGGQGGDEIFGGYTRYLIAYFEQCIKGAIDGTLNDGNYIVTYESIIPNLQSLQSYKPLLKKFWREGLFESRDKRYFQLINRAPQIGDEVNWSALTDYSPYETFLELFNAYNVEQGSYFDSMTHFDFKTLLPALLQVEDRVSMAHGLEARVPLLDHPLIELAATIPSNIKFKDGRMKHILKGAMGHTLPDTVLNRKDKMGFPVPLVDWLSGSARDFIYDIFSTEKSLSRHLVDNKKVLDKISNETQFGRTIWGFFSLEVWQQQFHDKAAFYKNMLNEPIQVQHQ